LKHRVNKHIGYSWFAAATGFVCDSLVNVEIVTGAGDIINANATSNSDLFLVLKGGGNNFGIVTKYVLKAFPFGNLWGGIMVYPQTGAAAQIAAFVDFTNNIKNDLSANLINIWSYQQATGASLILNCLEYTKPIVAPAPYTELLALPDLIASTMRVTNLTSLTVELAEATHQNARYIFTTLTFTTSAAMYQKCVDISNSYLEPFKASPNLTWSLLFQPIPRVVSDASVKAGGNIMGVDSNAGNLMLFLLFITWEGAENDAAFNKAGRACIADIKAAGAALGVNVPYMYMNYADQPEDVLAGYGAVNVAKMVKASKKYDPNQVFQKLVPGGWKL
jgi:hypothetical protein